jgi:tRNA(fMet)-specific endonuclease VapC
MTLVFDTSALSNLLNYDDTIMREVTKVKYDRYIVPLSTDAELRYGFANGNRQENNLSDYEGLKKTLNLIVINPNQDTSSIYAGLAAWCRQNGKSLSNNDIWIAATCVQVGGELITLDEDFKYLPQIRLVDV